MPAHDPSGVDGARYAAYPATATLQPTVLREAARQLPVAARPEWLPTIVRVR